MSTPGDSQRARGVDEESFARDLALMLHSGLSLMEALATLQERAEGSGATVVDSLVRRLRQGESLAAAMQAAGAFRPALTACVRSSELTGDLADSLSRYAQHAARLRLLRSRIVSALVYPAVVVGVAGLVVMFLVFYVVPRFAVVLESSGQQLPVMSRALIALGTSVHGLPTPAWLALAAAAGWALFALARAVREQRLQALLADAASRLPVLRDLARQYGQSQFVRSSAMLVRSGVPALKAMAMCGELLARNDRPGLLRALDAASAGQPLAAALHQHGLVDTLGLRVLRVAERTGALEMALDRLADTHDQALERVLERVGRLVEPALMLGIGLLVGGIVVLMYLPIFQLASAL